jgi:hypothetical protein
MLKSKKVPTALRKTLGFLISKGLLHNDDIDAEPAAVLDVSEAINCALNYEPRILEVLPSAVLRFPASFTGIDKAPEKFNAVLRALKANADVGPELAGIPFSTIKRWANFTLPDKRTKPVSERRVMKSVRLHPSTIAEIKRRANDLNTTESDVIDRAFRRND